jgi:hypothetical protein
MAAIPIHFCQFEGDLACRLHAETYFAHRYHPVIPAYRNPGSLSYSVPECRVKTTNSVGLVGGMQAKR